ncbi:HET-domain-containing protein [Westerdykella ornata]|uniref:HET-domain-containing protein n=1 Tax=Westerdykella ornata TaxID=318751 RepID=A0A6A6JWW1_WESOR|nr:HET-domain-containing protein [Westerdykella ornata]KAF2281102.1 HET-domain-containing protein [Westerdykella ornata]
MDISDHSTKSLCHICRTIDFPVYFQSPGPSNQKDITDTPSSNKEQTLGSRLQLRERATTCPFCHLVDTATDRPFRNRDEDGSVTIGRACIAETGNSEAGDTQKVHCIQVSVHLTEPVRKYVGYVQFLGEDAEKLGISSAFRGRVVREGRFDVRLAKRWLEICQKEHGKYCSNPDNLSPEHLASLQPMDLLAIDLENMCICEMPHGSPFVALSYCWPAAPYLTHLKSNSAELFSKGSLTRNMQRLPGTIQDAIKCSKDLAFRYLWIDALCIIQDSKEHKGKQLRQMDRVYGAAELTIVCAYPVPKGTPDPCSGLPGFSKPSPSKKQLIKSVSDLRMAATSMCASDALRTARWDTRCWTYQEHHLSRRLLFFTHVQAYFLCSCNAFAEDTVCESIPRTAAVEPGTTLWSPKARYGNKAAFEGRWGQWSLSRAKIAGIGLMMETYENALSEYTYRDVSFPTDILNAFDGIRAVLAEAMETAFFQGLPEIFFDHALCWVPKGVCKRRKSREEQADFRLFDPARPLFPSWSWAGWETPVNLGFWMANWAYRSEVDWFLVNREGMAVKLGVPRERHERLVYEKGGNKDVGPPEVDMRDFLPNIVPRDAIDPMAEEWLNAKILAAYTTSAHFWIDGTPWSLQGHERAWPGNVNLAIKDSRKRVVGCILLPIDLAEDCQEDPMQFEFILVSRALRQRQTETQKKLRYFDTGEFEEWDWCTLNVMLVRRLRSGVAFRVGVGMVHEEAWIEAGPRGSFVRLV